MSLMESMAAPSSLRAFGLCVDFDMDDRDDSADQTANDTNDIPEEVAGEIAHKHAAQVHTRAGCLFRHASTSRVRMHHSKYAREVQSCDPPAFGQIR